MTGRPEAALAAAPEPAPAAPPPGPGPDQGPDAAEPPAAPRLTPARALLALVRGTALALNTFGCLALLLLVRLLEAPLFGPRRPVTPFITQYVCRSAFLLLGMGYRVHGAPMRGAGAVVANHGSWLDIFALNAGQRVTFVSKAEVAGWPGIGWLARATGTLFIRRERREAQDHVRAIAARLSAGEQLLFFPEGTSSDGQRVLPFKTTLYEALLAQGGTTIQPVSVVYHPPAGEDPRFYAWWGAMDLAPHLLKVLGTPAPGRVELVYHPPIPAADHAGRKALARACELAVRAGFETHR